MVVRHRCLQRLATQHLNTPKSGGDSVFNLANPLDVAVPGNAVSMAKRPALAFGSGCGNVCVKDWLSSMPSVSARGGRPGKVAVTSSDVSEVMAFFFEVVC